MADQAEKLREEMERANADVGRDVLRMFHRPGGQTLQGPKPVCRRCSIRESANKNLCRPCRATYYSVRDDAREWESADPRAAREQIFRAILAEIKSGNNTALVWLRDVVACDLPEHAAMCLEDVEGLPGFCR